MRLIDADAEICKIEAEINRTNEEISRWEERKKNNDIGMYDINAKIASLRRNISDAKREIRALRTYEVAYDPDKVVEALMNRFRVVSSDEDLEWNRAIDYAVGIVKGGKIK